MLSVLVENRPGVLQRVASMVRRRGFNIDSLSVGTTEDSTVSRMTITVHVGRQAAEQAMKQLYKLVDVIKIDDITTERVVAHELLLIKVNAPSRGRRDLLDIVAIFGGRVVDVASNTVIVELTGPAEKVDNFIELCGPFGIKEVARSGAVAIVRGNAARLRLVDKEEREDADLRPTGTDADIMGVV
ncbi:MAG TPA: acetolactate synthase small subunit [Candidatus Dormibacteraeota bacterium]|nr:acetolactate synthase small subunit [Candidatus Dormibacteraeota bacterium]